MSAQVRQALVASVEAVDQAESATGAAPAGPDPAAECPAVLAACDSAVRLVLARVPAAVRAAAAGAARAPESVPGVGEDGAGGASALGSAAVAVAVPVEASGRASGAPIESANGRE